MAKLRFDPIIYQFYYQCPPQEGAPAKAAGLGGIQSDAGTIPKISA
jgi:hypothetical protein